MSLVDRFPHTRRLALPSDSADSDAVCPPGLLPYLDWRLAMIDSSSADILLQSPDERDLVVLTGTAANIWLRYHATRPAHGEADAARGPAQTSR